MSELIKPCPFCGGKPTTIEMHMGRGMVQCCKCGASTDPDEAKTPEELIKAWNTRYERTCESSYCKETDEWQCHNCGGTLQSCAMFDPDVDGFVDTPKFCPNCGAKVIE